MSFRVLVDDNFHYMDLEERWSAGEYETAAEALSACRRIVERSLAEQYKAGMGAEQLELYYQTFGEDPFIVSTEIGVIPPRFSAWDYARVRSQEMVQANSCSVD